MAAEEAAPELTEAQQAKLAAKQFKADSRKLAKALKGKKPEPKLEAIDRCREDAAFLAKGECLVPLLQQCVFKKTKKGDNADVVQAALSCARAFLEAAPESQPDEEEGAAATPEPWPRRGRSRAPSLPTRGATSRRRRRATATAPRSRTTS